VGRIILRWALIFIGVLVVVYLRPDWVTYQDWTSLVVFAAIIGLLNVFLRPLVRLLTCPLVILTFGLFALVINAFIFGLAARLTPGVQVHGFWGAFWGALIVTLVSWVAGMIVGSEKKDRDRG
jgi:putative membrane protein